MNITRLNIQRQLPQARQMLLEADVLAIDLEMTGINNDRLLRNSVNDTPEARY